MKNIILFIIGLTCVNLNAVADTLIMVTNSNWVTTSNPVIKIVDGDDNCIGIVHKGETRVFSVPQLIWIRVNQDGYTTNEFALDIPTDGTEFEFNEAFDMAQSNIAPGVVSNGYYAVQTPSITPTTMNAAMGAGLGTWVMPLALVALLKFARKGANIGGSVL